jgi:hypothetical protein
MRDAAAVSLDHPLAEQGGWGTTLLWVAVALLGVGVAVWLWGRRPRLLGNEGERRMEDSPVVGEAAAVPAWNMRVHVPAGGLARRMVPRQPQDRLGARPWSPTPEIRQRELPVAPGMNPFLRKPPRGNPFLKKAPGRSGPPLAPAPPVSDVEVPTRELVPSEDLPLVEWSEVQVGELIGRGAFGAVYRGRFRGHNCAVKTIHIEATHSSEEVREATEDFVKEALMHSSMKHPNILQILALVVREVPPRPSTARALTVENVVAIVTELCDAGSLWDQLHHPSGVAPVPATPEPSVPHVLCAGPIPPREIAQLGLDIASGLAYLHSFSPPVLHRDLKSGNVLVRTAGCTRPRLVLADFGLARAKSRAGADNATMTAGLGTLQWTAPEVLVAERYSEAADIYSFGLILWELAHRPSFPWEGVPPGAIAVAVARGERPAIDRSRCGPSLASLITKCLAPHAADRPTAFSLVRILESMT